MSQLPADFYRPDDLAPENNIAFLAKAVQASIVQQAGPQLAKYGLTHAQWRPLIKLARAGRSVSVAELARDLQVDMGAMTRMLDRLQDKGFCLRMRSGEDRRVVLVELTQLGLEAASHAPSLVSKILNAHLAGFTRDEWQAVVTALRRIVANGEAMRAIRRPSDLR